MDKSYKWPTFNGFKEKVLSLEIRDLISTAETVDSRSFLCDLLILRSDIADLFERKYLIILNFRRPCLIDQY